MRPLLALPAFLLLAGCAAWFPRKNPRLAPCSVEIRGDTAVYRGLYRAGGVRSELALVDGKREGPALLYFPDGGLQQKRGFQGGMAEGEAVTFFPGGRRSRVEFYLRDTLQVHRTLEYDSTGARISEWTPAGDSLTGSLILRRNGQVVDSAFFVRGKREGKSFTLGAKGDTVAKAFHRNAKPDSVLGNKPILYPRTTESILRTIRKRTPDLRHTYNAHLANSRFGGKVTLQFRIRPDGGLDFVLPIGDTTRKPRFVRDIVNRIQDWKFQAIDASSMDVVTVPFTFSE